MPFQEKDSKFNQKLAAMRLGHDSNIDMEDPGNMEHMMYPHQFDSTDEVEYSTVLITSFCLEQFPGHEA